MTGCNNKDEDSDLRNITINIPDCFDTNIQKLIKNKVVPSRSEAIRRALRDFLGKEENFKLLNCEVCSN